MFKVTRLITQPPRHIIKHTSLLCLSIDDSLATSRLRLLSSVVGGLYFFGQMEERLPAPTP